jgi:hypothetical protein
MDVSDSVLDHVLYKGTYPEPDLVVYQTHEVGVAALA